MFWNLLQRLLTPYTNIILKNEENRCGCNQRFVVSASKIVVNIYEW